MRERVNSHVFGRGFNEFAKQSLSGRGVEGEGGGGRGCQKPIPLFAQRT